MAKVLWSDQAEAVLELINPAVRDQLVRNAEDTLHDIPPRANPADEGNVGEVMWHRGGTHELESHGPLWEEDDGGVQAWDYFLIYRSAGDDAFEVLAIVSTHQIATRWVQMSREEMSGGLLTSHGRWPAPPL